MPIGTESFQFMKDLWDNNNKSWFDENRKRYEKVLRNPMKELAEDLSGPISIILPEFTGKVKVSRINNDIRFSPNKPPYKEHMWISFGGGHGCSSADIFMGIDRNGWTTGCGIGSNKREPLDEWRRNLIDNIDLWRKYASAIGLGTEVMTFIDQSYKKPLFSDTPEDIYKIVQAKGIWVIDKSRKSFEDDPEVDTYNAIGKFLPLYHFMNSTGTELKDKLAYLADFANPPTDEVEKIWGIFG